MAPHALHKGGDLVSELGLAAGPELLRIVGEDGQRRLESVRQIRGVRPGPFDRRILSVQQAVDLGGKRLNFVGKVCPEPRRGAGADRCEPAADRIERPQTDPHLHPGGGDENGGENGERGRQFAGEGAPRSMDFAAIDGDRGPDRAAAETLWQGDVPLQNKERRPAGAGDCVTMNLAGSQTIRSEGRACRPRVSANAARPRRALP